MKKLEVIWALFDDGNCSYRKAMETFHNGKFKVYSIGINERNENLEWNDNYIYKKIDISLINFNLLNEFETLDKPDIILASPPCESWSIADSGATMVKKINNDCTWQIQNKKFYDDYNAICEHAQMKRQFHNKEQSRILGESTIGATIRLIQVFKPKFWVIENPQTSKSWQYQKNHWGFEGVENLTFYSSYNEKFSLKPTIFKSNFEMDLSSKKKFGDNSYFANGSYDQRSSIPDTLIAAIIDNYINLKDKPESEKINGIWERQIRI